MIKWKRNYTYFRDEADKLVTSALPFSEAISNFLRTYNCTITEMTPSGMEMMECTEEDFLIIKLKCPQAIDRIIMRSDVNITYNKGSFAQELTQITR